MASIREKEERSEAYGVSDGKQNVLERDREVKVEKRNQKVKRFEEHFLKFGNKDISLNSKAWAEFEQVCFHSFIHSLKRK